MKKLYIFAAYDYKGASSKYRILQYKEQLEKEFHVKYSFFWENNYIEKYLKNRKRYVLHISIQYVIKAAARIFEIIFSASGYDAVFFQKACIPYMKPFLIDWLKKRNVGIIFDVDDAVWLRKFDYSDQIARKADAVLCGSKELIVHYQQFNNNCMLAPTLDDPLKYRPYKGDTFHKKVIGWIGSKQTIHNLDIIAEPLNKIILEYPEVSFLLICDDDYGYQKKIMNCNFCRWDEKTYTQLLATMTIGVMPLADTAENRGKCGFKLVQYLTMGKPVIASDIGENKKIVGDCGYVLSNNHLWYEQFKKLLFDEAVYREKERKIETQFAKAYNYEYFSDRLVSLIKEIMSK